MCEMTLGKLNLSGFDSFNFIEIEVGGDVSLLTNVKTDFVRVAAFSEKNFNYELFSPL
jgi:hypothetical protein